MTITRNQKWWGLGIATSIVAVFLGVSLMKDRTEKVPDVVSSVEVPVLSVDRTAERRGKILREVEAPSKVAEKSVAKPKPVVHASTSMTYVVKDGDWLSTICPSDWPEVAKINNLANPDYIRAGWTLKLTEKCNEVEFIATRGGSTKTTLVVAKEEASAPVVTSAEPVAASSVPIREEKEGEKPSVASAPLVQGNASRVSTTVSALPYCEIDALPFNWQNPGINPIGVDDPKEYLDCLAESEGLPEEAREYFLAELRKGDQGDFDQIELRDGEFLNAMVGRKVNGKIRVHQETTKGWPNAFYRENSPISNGVRRKQTVLEKKLNSTARKYVITVGNDRWILLRAYICGNLILRREEVAPPPVVETPSVELEPMPMPVPTPQKYTGTCVPLSRPQDCAMSGCVLRSLSDASPACANSCESAPKMNSDSVPNGDRIHPVVDGTCSLSDARPDERPRHTTFTVLGGAFINETDPIKICRMTPDVEYRGRSLVCLADGSVMKRGE